MFSEDSRRVTTSITIDLPRRYLRAAEIQVTRIWDDARQRLPTVYEDMLIDVHFYFVALRDIYRYLDKVVSDEVFQGLRPALDNLNEKWFKHYSDGRDVFEHIDQRLPGQSHENRIVGIEAWGGEKKINFGLSPRKGLFRHSDLEWDISKARYDRIKVDVEELLRLIVDAAPKGQ